MSTEASELSGSQPEGEPSATDAGTPPTGQGQPDKATDPNVTANGEKLDRQTRNWRALERDRDHWREMALRMQPPSQQPPAPREAPPANADQLKQLSDFEYDEGKYQRYLHDTLRSSITEEVRAAIRTEISGERERQESERRRSSFRSRETEFAKTVNDYEDVARDRNLAISPDMADVIQESDDGPALLYHLGKNPDIAEKIAQLPAKAAARELGKIEARLAFERERAAEAKKKVSEAPPPPSRVEGADPGSLNVKPGDADSDKLSDEEWTRRRNKQIAKQRGS